MRTENDPAFPCKTEKKEIYEDGARYTQSDFNFPGLSKREYFAAMAMQGIEASNFETEHQVTMPSTEIAKRSVELADALIAELEKGNR